MKVISFCLRLLFSILLVTGFGRLAAEAYPQHTVNILDYLTPSEGVKMTLEADITTLIQNKKSNQYYPGTLITDKGETFQLELRPRGKFRRKIAEIPPLKLKFKKKSLVASGFDTINELKLVLPCFDNYQGDELIIREYLIYKMYEQLTPAGVRARLIRLTIRDTHVEKSKRTMYAILLEDDEGTAARLSANPVDAYGLPADSLAGRQAALMVLFEYMIGNTDWDIAMQRNVRLVRGTDSGKVITIPYDFDFSGFVNAPYATPSSESGLKTVRDRYLMSYGIRPEMLKHAAQHLRANREQLFAICRSRLLTRESINELTEYLDAFYRILETSDEVPGTLRMLESD